MVAQTRMLKRYLSGYFFILFFMLTVQWMGLKCVTYTTGWRITALVITKGDYQTLWRFLWFCWLGLCNNEKTYILIGFDEKNSFNHDKRCYLDNEHCIISIMNKQHHCWSDVIDITTTEKFMSARAHCNILL